MENKKLSKKAMQTKKKIFDTTIQIFKEKGYFNTTTREITKKAGVATGSFFTYFKSKESVLAEFTKEMEISLVKYLETIENKSAKEKLLSYFEYIFNWTEKNFGIEFYAVTLSYYSQRTFKVPNDYDIHSNEWIYRDFLKEYIVEGQNNGEFRKDIDKDTLYKIIEIFLHGIQLNWCIYLGTYSLSEKGKEYVSLIIDNVLVNK